MVKKKSKKKLPYHKSLKTHAHKQGGKSAIALPYYQLPAETIMAEARIQLDRIKRTNTR